MGIIAGEKVDTACHFDDEMVNHAISLTSPPPTPSHGRRDTTIIIKNRGKAVLFRRVRRVINQC